MFDTAPVREFNRKDSGGRCVAFQFTGLNMDLPDWFVLVMRRKGARFTDGSLEVQHITGKFWSVSKGQYVLLTGLGNVHVMDADDFDRMYKEAGL